jgi:hypothetical protein
MRHAAGNRKRRLPSQRKTSPREELENGGWKLTNNREYVWVKPKKHRMRNIPDAAARIWPFLNTGGPGGKLFISGTSFILFST